MLTLPTSHPSLILHVSFVHGEDPVATAKRGEPTQSTQASIAIGLKTQSVEECHVLGKGVALSDNGSDQNSQCKAALADAMVDANLDREQREVLWKAYGAARGKDGQLKFD